MYKPPKPHTDRLLCACSDRVNNRRCDRLFARLLHLYVFFHPSLAASCRIRGKRQQQQRRRRQMLVVSLQLILINVSATNRSRRHSVFYSKCHGSDRLDARRHPSRPAAAAVAAADAATAITPPPACNQE